MLKTDRIFPMIAKQDIKCFKVMVKWKNAFYVCPPAFQYYLQDDKLVEYQLNVLYSEKSNDSNKDYRKDWVIWEWFFHTFTDIELAKDFVDYLNQRINNKKLTKNPELYVLPLDAELIILDAIIPKGSLYYEWPYKEVKSQKTYASNKIIYTGIYTEQKEVMKT